MALDLDNTTHWSVTGGSVDASNVFTEDAANNRHSVHQDVQGLVDGGLGTTVTYRCTIEPRSRTRFWMGCRQNNGTYMASFDTVGPTVTSEGSKVSSSSIADNDDGN